MINRLTTLALAALLATPALAQHAKAAASTAAPAPSTPLPVDPKVRIGTLPNGIRYYIRQNPKPISSTSAML